MNKRGSALIQVLLVMTAAVMISCGTLRAAAFAMRSTERRIRKEQCEILASSIALVLQEKQFEAGTEPWNSGTSVVFELETEILPGRTAVEWFRLGTEEASEVLAIRVTTSIRDASATVTVPYEPDAQCAEYGNEQEGDE